MIRINLIPPEVAKKAAKKKLIALVGFAGSVVISIAVVVFLARVAVNRALSVELSKLEKEVQKYKAVAEDVKKLKDTAAMLESKKGVIEKLMKGRLLYPKFMEEFMELIPAPIWFTSFNTQSTQDSLSVSISCISIDNFAIADFISNLESSKKFSSVEIGAISTGGPIAGSKESYTFPLKFSYKTTL